MPCLDLDLHWCMVVLGVPAEMRHFKPALSSEPVKRRVMQTDYVFVLSEPRRVFAGKTLFAWLVRFLFEGAHVRSWSAGGDETFSNLRYHLSRSGAV